MKRLSIVLLTLYQYTLSPDHGLMRVFFPLGACRFYPSCSEYAKQSIQRYGAWRGWSMGLRQLSHCHPFYNPNIKNKKSKLQIKIQKYSESF